MRFLHPVDPWYINPWDRGFSRTFDRHPFTRRSSTMIKIAVVLLAVSTGFCLPGMFTGSWARTQFLSDPHPYLSDNFNLFRVGTSMELSPLLNMVARFGYGSAAPSETPVSEEGNYIGDENGRLWMLQAGADANLPGMDMFFLRATAGGACLLLDYLEGSSSYYERRITESRWEPAFSLGLGSRFDLDFIPHVSTAEFTLSLEQIGSYGLISGEIGLGFGGRDACLISR